MPDNLKSVVKRFYDDYVQSTPKKLKIIDAYLLYILLTGIIQFVYCCLVGTFPFNSFLSGFISSVGSFILAGKRIRLCFHNFGEFCVLLELENCDTNLMHAVGRFMQYRSMRCMLQYASACVT